MNDHFGWKSAASPKTIILVGDHFTGWKVQQFWKTIILTKERFCWVRWLLTLQMKKWGCCEPSWVFHLRKTKCWKKKTITFIILCWREMMPEWEAERKIKSGFKQVRLASFVLRILLVLICKFSEFAFFKIRINVVFISQDLEIWNNVYACWAKETAK